MGRWREEAVKSEREPGLGQEGLPAGACWRETSGPDAESVEWRGKGAQRVEERQRT